MQFKILTLTLYTETGEAENEFELLQKLHVAGEKDTQRIIEQKADNRNEAAIINLGKACVYLDDLIKKAFIHNIDIDARIELADDLTDGYGEHFELFSRLRYLNNYESTRGNLELDVGSDKVKWLDKIVYLLKSRNIKLYFENISTDKDFEKRKEYYQNIKKDRERELNTISNRAEFGKEFVFKHLKNKEEKENV